MSHEDSSVTRRLLSLTNMEKVVIENEMESENQPEPDLRLHDAVLESIDEVEDLIAENEDLVYEKDDEGHTALHILCISGDDDAPKILKLLLGVTEPDDGRIQNVDRQKILHDTDDQGFTALHYSARSWFPLLTEALLKYGANPSAQDSKGNTPLQLACEGNSERALECVKLILKYDTDGSLINTKNGSEITPLHKALREQAPQMVKLLLNPEYKLNLSNLTSRSGQNILHYLCLEPGESEKSCEILQMILNSCTPAFVNGVDVNGRTVLHLAAIERLPKFTEILTTHVFKGGERIDVLKVDKRQRHALHYACENGSYPDGYECVESLIKFTFDRSRTQIQHLYEMNDEVGSSAFMYAALNCPVETMQKYLNAILEPQFWMSETNMTLVYKQSPSAIKALMDRAFTERKMTKNAEQDIIVTDFGPITGYVDPVEKLPQQETKYLKQSQWWDFETQKEILMHPLVQLFLVNKCQKLRWIIYGWIFWQLLWLLAYTIVVLSPTYCNVMESTTTAIVFALFMTIYIIMSLINEVFEIYSVGITYLLSVTNLAQLIQIILGLIAVSPVILGYDASLAIRNCAATGVLMAYILSMRDVGKMHEEIGLVVEVLKQVVIQIIKVLLCCSPLLLGFTLAFIMLFDKEEGFNINTTFPGPLVKILVMMTGEFEYNDTFKGDEDGEKLKPNKNMVIRLIFFLSFLICVPVAFFNLLTGFALDRVMELRERAKVGRIAKQLEYIYFIESILLSLNPLKKLLPHDTVIAWLRNHNVTTAMIDGELKFETFLKEETHKKIDRRTVREKQLAWMKCRRPIFSTELPADVRHQMFKLASSSKN